MHEQKPRSMSEVASQKHLPTNRIRGEQSTDLNRCFYQGKLDVRERSHGDRFVLTGLGRKEPWHLQLHDSPERVTTVQYPGASQNHLQDQSVVERSQLDKKRHIPWDAATRAAPTPAQGVPRQGKIEGRRRVELPNVLLYRVSSIAIPLTNRLYRIKLLHSNALTLTRISCATMQWGAMPITLTAAASATSCCP